MLSRIKFDISVLVNEMLDQLPKYIWTNYTTTFLDLAMGGGQFVGEIERRLRAAGHSDENIKSRVFGYETSNLHIRYAINRYKLVGTYAKLSYEDVFKMSEAKKFDVIVGNPPYQDTKKSGNALWSLFVQKSFNDLLNTKGFVAYITPARWVLPGCNIKKEKIRIWSSFIQPLKTMVINLGECSRYFKEGSTGDYFSYFIVQNTLSKKSDITNLQTSTEILKVNLHDIEWLPLRNCNSISLNIVQKIQQTTSTYFSLAWKYDRTQIDLKESPTKEFSHKVFVGNNTIKFSNHAFPDCHGPKVLFKLGRFIEYPKRIYIDKDGDVNYNSAYIIPLRKDDNVEYLTSKLYIFLAKCLNSGSEITAEGYRSLPKLDTSRSWSDEEIYKYFNLTPEEIKYIEDNVK